MWEVKYALLIATATLVGYVSAIKIEATSSEKQKKVYLWLPTLVNLGILFIFKYFNFFFESIQSACEAIGVEYYFPALKLLLPVGISFYTFQVMSYCVDVYRGEMKAEKHLGHFALYISFFPQLVAGPIERSKNLLPQIKNLSGFNAQNTSDGLKLILWGFFKKMVIADRIGMLVDPVYANPEHYSGAFIFVAVVLFAYQIYCDFSGYTDIAIGSAKVLGISLMLNFNKPFSAKSMTEFWRRWHISLSTWINDYIFMPLSIRYRNWGKVGTALALFITFYLAGVWHGAGWTFVIYGILHGLFMSGEYLTKKRRKKLIKKAPLFYKFWGGIYMFAAYCLTLVFFRATDIKNAWDVIKGILVFQDGTGLNQISKVLPLEELIIIVLGLFVVELAQSNQKDEYIINVIKSKTFKFRIATYLSLTLAVIYLAITEVQSFIYFQF